MDTVEYQGDYTKSLHNAILGPDANGDFFVVEDVTYQNDATTAQLRPATEDEVENCTWDSNGMRHLAV